jgi:hypothetical protein
MNNQPTCKKCGSVCTQNEDLTKAPFECPECNEGLFDFEIEMVDFDNTLPGKSYSTTRHMGVDIQGFLNNYKRRKMTGLMSDENGRKLSDAECREYLAECQSKGWKVIPMCHDKECPGFDYFGKGCPGHPKKVTNIKVGE